MNRATSLTHQASRPHVNTTLALYYLYLHNCCLALRMRCKHMLDSSSCFQSLCFVVQEANTQSTIYVDCRRRNAKHSCFCPHTCKALTLRVPRRSAPALQVSRRTRARTLHVPWSSAPTLHTTGALVQCNSKACAPVKCASTAGALEQSTNT